MQPRGKVRASPPPFAARGVEKLGAKPAEEAHRAEPRRGRRSAPAGPPKC